MKANRILAAAVMALGLLSCKGEAPKEAPQRKMDFPVSISIEGNKGAMRAAQQGTSLTASYQNEHAIENLTIVVFSNNSTAGDTPLAVEKVITEENIVMPAGGNPYDGVIKFDMEAAGTYHMEVIANGYKQGDAAAKAALIAKLSPGLSYANFQKIVFDRALPKHGESGFAMLGTDPVKVTTEQGKTANAGKIVLRRLACRFDVFNKLLGDELVLTKATLQNQIKKSYLLTQTAVPADADGGIQSYEANNDWFTASVITGGIYSYENPAKGATTLLLEGTYKGTPWKKTIEFKDGGNAIAMQRNHLYRVYLTKGTGVNPGGDDDTADKVNYEIEVLDWEQGDEIAYSDSDLLKMRKTFTRYTFTADKNSVDHMGGMGHITGMKTIYAGTDTTGQVLAREPLAPSEYSLALKSIASTQITLDNDTKNFTIAKGNKGASFTIQAKHKESGIAQNIIVKRVGINPLEYMAKTNLDSLGRFLPKEIYGYSYGSHHYGYFTSKGAKKRFGKVTIGGVPYHLPTLEDWLSIFPLGDFDASKPDQGSSTGLFSLENGIPKDIEQTVRVNGENITSSETLLLLEDASFKTADSKKVYALRYKGGKYQSAWSYELYFTRDGISPEVPNDPSIIYPSDQYYYLLVRSCLVPDNVSIQDIAKESFWSSNTEQTVYRILTTTGYRNLVSETEVQPTSDFYNNGGSAWCFEPQVSSYRVDSDKYPHAYISFGTYATLSLVWGYAAAGPVRLFRDTLE